MKSAAATRQRAIWLKRMHEWHWISSAVALMGLLFFAVTGITLNHASSLESTQQQFRSLDKDMPPALVAALVEDIRQNGEGEAPPTDALRDWIREAFGVDTANRNADWKAEEIMFTLERPGGDAWLRLDLVRGAGEYHVTDAGWVAYLNDLHKGRHTGSGWSWFIDLIAAACVIFAVTGFVILKMHAANRALTWPLVGAGLLVPLVIAALFIH
ncbi:MAG TPA: PepSY-associated TM helix domain-containing protein [Steroidobacteraceae bacterium]|nr:PepSY-associated TM helix domain-containing protein [Steroidobacteraceae bacterium]